MELFTSHAPSQYVTRVDFSVTSSWSGKSGTTSSARPAFGTRRVHRAGYVAPLFALVQRAVSSIVNSAAPSGRYVPSFSTSVPEENGVPFPAAPRRR